MEKPDTKHPCPDCHHCQWCSDDRCRLCLASEKGCRKKLSMAEQIALFERINRIEPELDPCCPDAASSAAVFPWKKP
jgi:hypothetical protein